MFEITDFEKYIVIRRRKKITLKEIAKAIKCTSALISAYEKQKTNMSDEKLQKYREYILNN